ncbi:MAG: ATP-binding protein [Candidatus Woesearchaeota archaeon]
MLIKRSIFSKLESELDSNKITALVGSRQVGKTTIMKALKNKTSNSEYISFDDFDILDLFENNLKLFSKRYVENKDFLFIDEFQCAKNGGRALKFLFDTYKCKIFISGSSAPDLTINSLQYLVGRVNIFIIYPLNFKEYLSFKDPKSSFLLESERFEDLSKLDGQLLEYLKYGGYPGVVISKDPEFELKNLVKIYLFKEIKDVLKYKDSREFDLILKKLAIQDGSILNKSNISKDVDINRKKIDEILHVLKNTYVIYLLKPFLNNKSKELIKSSKTYFCDLGFKNSLVNNFNDLHLRVDKGAILESFVLSQIERFGFKPSFWNYKNLYEVDFVLEKNAHIFAFEVKSKLANANISKSVKRFIEEYKPAKFFILNDSFNLKTSFMGVDILFINKLGIVKILENL